MYIYHRKSCVQEHAMCIYTIEKVACKSMICIYIYTHSMLLHATFSIEICNGTRLTINLIPQVLLLDLRK